MFLFYFYLYVFISLLKLIAVLVGMIWYLRRNLSISPRHSVHSLTSGYYSL